MKKRLILDFRTEQLRTFSLCNTHFFTQFNIRKVLSYAYHNKNEIYYNNLNYTISYDMIINIININMKKKI